MQIGGNVRQHLKVGDVAYVTRPLTIFEKTLWDFLLGPPDRGTLPESHPQFYPLWAQFLWSRQDEVLPLELFSDILVPDFQDHVNECLGQFCIDSIANNLLEVSWNKFTPGVEPPDYAIKASLREWKKHLDA